MGDGFDDVRPAAQVGRVARVLTVLVTGAWVFGDGMARVKRVRRQVGKVAMVR